MSSIFNIRKPLGTLIGFVCSFIFRFFIADLTLLFSEFSLIQSSLPPRFDVGDMLYSRAATSNPLSLITLSISLNLLSNSFRFETSKEISENKYDFRNLLLFLILHINDIKNSKIEIDIEKEFKLLENYEKNNQLNQYSKIYFNKVKKDLEISEL